MDETDELVDANQWRFVANLTIVKAMDYNDNDIQMT